MNETLTYVKATLKDYFRPEEIRSLTHLLFKEVCGLEPHQLLLYKDKDLSNAEKEKIRSITERLIKNEPIQYLLGKAICYDFIFLVNPSVLIPRPETEELIDLIVRRERTKGLQLLDIGTGSGCIAISLAKALDEPDVSAIDISADALQVAQQNAKINQAKVRFFQMDILKSADLPVNELDIIVSNPPYVMNGEKTSMRPNVLDYEPHTALFVSDNDPLVFYREIARLGKTHLKCGGRIYFEINAALGIETQELLVNEGYRDCCLVKDISGKDRILYATR